MKYILNVFYFVVSTKLLLLCWLLYLVFVFERTSQREIDFWWYNCYVYSRNRSPHHFKMIAEGMPTWSLVIKNNPVYMYVTENHMRKTVL